MLKQYWEYDIENEMTSVIVHVYDNYFIYI